MTYLADIPRCLTEEDLRKAHAEALAVDHREIESIDQVLQRGLIRPSESSPSYGWLFFVAAGFGLAAALIGCAV